MESSWKSDMQHRPATWLVLLTMFLSFALEFLPWSAFFWRIKPIFPVLALLYWVLHYPRLINYSAGIIVGVMMDLSNQTPLGFNAAGCSVIVLMTNLFYGRFALLGGVGQAVHVFIILAAGQLTVFLLSLLEDASLSSLGWRLFFPSMSAAAFWLVLPLLLRYLRRAVSDRKEDAYG